MYDEQKRVYGPLCPHCEVVFSELWGNTAVNHKLTVKQSGMDDKVREEGGWRGLLLFNPADCHFAQPLWHFYLESAHLLLNGDPACMDDSDSGKPFSAN